MSVKGFLDDHYEKCRQKFYSHVRPWIVIGVEMAKATGWRMSYDQYTALIDFLGGMNSYERRILVPLLDDLGVCAITEYNMSQYRTLSELGVAVVYDESVQRELAPLLVKRLREAAKELAKAQEEDTRAGEAFDDRIAEAEKWHAKWKHAEQDRDAARSEAEAWRKRAAEWETKQHFAQKQAAIWEIEAQDLRDRLVQAEAALTHNTIACVR